MDKYNKEDLETDLDWFKGLGVDKNEAISYIKFLLSKKESSNLWI